MNKYLQIMCTLQTPSLAHLEDFNLLLTIHHENRYKFIVEVANGYGKSI